MENRTIKIRGTLGSERENRVLLIAAKPRPAIRSAQLDIRRFPVGSVGRQQAALTHLLGELTPGWIQVSAQTASIRRVSDNGDFDKADSLLSDLVKLMPPFAPENSNDWAMIYDTQAYLGRNRSLAGGGSARAGFNSATSAPVTTSIDTGSGSVFFDTVGGSVGGNDNLNRLLNVVTPGNAEPQARCLATGGTWSAEAQACSGGASSWWPVIPTWAKVGAGIGVVAAIYKFLK